METLGQKQKRFAKLVPRLIDKAHEMGYEVTLGDAYRDPRAFGDVGVFKTYGNASSDHKKAYDDALPEAEERFPITKVTVNPDGSETWSAYP